MANQFNLVYDMAFDIKDKTNIQTGNWDSTHHNLVALVCWRRWFRLKLVRRVHKPMHDMWMTLNIACTLR